MIDVHVAALARSGSIETRPADEHPCRIRLASFAGEPTPLRGEGLSVGLAHCLDFIRERLETYRAQLRGAYFRDSVLNLHGLVDALATVPNSEKEMVHAS
jgi:hypothetical protein